LCENARVAEAKGPEVRVVGRVAGHYEVQEEMKFVRIHHWFPECVVVECKCGKSMSLTRSDILGIGPGCECGTDYTASVREEVVFHLLDEDHESHRHPWRYLHTLALHAHH
jgi:hypothetical protein